MGRIALSVIGAMSLIGWIASFGVFARWGFIGGVDDLCMRMSGPLYDSHWAWSPVPVGICEHYVDGDLVVGTTISSWGNTGFGGACGVVLVTNAWIILRRCRPQRSHSEISSL